MIELTYLKNWWITAPDKLMKIEEKVGLKFCSVAAGISLGQVVLKRWGFTQLSSLKGLGVWVIRKVGIWSLFGFEKNSKHWSHVKLKKKKFVPDGHLGKKSLFFFG